MQQHRPCWHMNVTRYCFSGSIPPNFEHNYIAIDKHVEKFPSYYMKTKICHDQGCNDIGVVIAIK